MKSLKSFFTKEWVILLLTNIVITGGTTVVELTNEGTLQPEAWVLPAVTCILSIARMFNKTAQDKVILERTKTLPKPPTE